MQFLTSNDTECAYHRDRGFLYPRKSYYFVIEMFAHRRTLPGSMNAPFLIEGSKYGEGTSCVTCMEWIEFYVSPWPWDAIHWNIRQRSMVVQTFKLQRPCYFPYSGTSYFYCTPKAFEPTLQLLNSTNPLPVQVPHRSQLWGTIMFLVLLSKIQ